MEKVEGPVFVTGCYAGGNGWYVPDEASAVEKNVIAYRQLEPFFMCKPYRIQKYKTGWVLVDEYPDGTFSRIGYSQNLVGEWKNVYGCTGAFEVARENDWALFWRRYKVQVMTIVVSVYTVLVIAVARL
jgi:hypothetical protein